MERPEVAAAPPVARGLKLQRRERTRVAAQDTPQPARPVRAPVMKYSNTISAIYIRGVPLHDEYPELRM